MNYDGVAVAVFCISQSTIRLVSSMTDVKENSPIVSSEHIERVFVGDHCVFAPPAMKITSYT